jgi:hypothetical protein
LDGDHYKSTKFPTFTKTFATTTIIDIGRFISYLIADRRNGETTSFCSVQTIRIKGTG